MPIYEFYCVDCHTIYNFFAKRPDTSKQPDCPHCGRPKLQRRLSAFAISKNRPEPQPGDDLPPGMDEAKLEQALADLEREGEGPDADDPRAMARMMRRLSEATGMSLDGPMGEAVRRMEAGEDPDKIEEEMGDVFDQADASPGDAGLVRRLSRKLRAPKVDTTLYDL